MIEKKKEIINDNVSNLFSFCRGLSPRMLYQANELVSLHESVDMDFAYETIVKEKHRIKNESPIAQFFWMRALCEIIYSKLSKEEIRDHLYSVFSSAAEVDERVKGKISYLKNKFTEKAFDRFSGIVNDAKILHTDSFEDSCEDAYNGVCEYCILPIKTSDDGRLHAFHRLIKKYDLRIAASTDVDNTTLILASRRADLFKDLDCLKNYRLEFSVTNADQADVDCIMSFASEYGMHLLRFDTTEGDEGGCHSFLFSADSISTERLEIFTLYLSAAFPSLSFIGIYRHLD